MTGLLENSKNENQDILNELNNLQAQYKDVNCGNDLPRRPLLRFPSWFFVGSLKCRSFLTPTLFFHFAVCAGNDEVERTLSNNNTASLSPPSQLAEN